MAPSHSGLRRKLITYFRLVMPKAKPKSKDRALKGWGQIVEFLGPDRVCGATLAESGMPVRREGRSVCASPEELTAWLDTEHGQKEPVHPDNPDPRSTVLARARFIAKKDKPDPLDMPPPSPSLTAGQLGPERSANDGLCDGEQHRLI